jgi:hypothetical protein
MSKKSKNKMKAWRRMSKKYRDENGTIVRPGRQLKMFTMGYEGKKQATGLLAALMKRMDNPFKDVESAFKFWNETKKEISDETK